MGDESRPLHPARMLPFSELVAGLEEARAAGMTVRRDDPATRRSLWCYSNKCVYESGWNPFSLMARGLILHEAEQRVVATPFPKFFNAGEHGQAFPDLPFETYEKIDGSLAIIHFHDGQWRAATKGAFDSAQALWTEARLRRQDTGPLVPGTTYLAEAISPENRIVVQYTESALVLLAAYREDGTEMEFGPLSEVADALGWRTAKRHAYTSLAALVADAEMLPATEEGFVIRFADGLRLKVKGAEYRRIHALISHCGPLALWEALAAGDDLTAIRRELPEEFWGDFDAILNILNAKLSALVSRIESAAASVSDLSDKELGLSLGTLPGDVRPFLFSYRKGGGKLEGKAHQLLFRAVRPTANVLEGYAPSYAMGRLMDESS